MNTNARHTASLVLLAFLASIALVVLPAKVALADEPANLAPIATLLPPCQVEDDVNCYWDAAESGNGLGWSFYAIGTPDAYCLTYPAHPEASRCK